MPKKRFTNVAEAFEGMLEEELDGDSSDYGAMDRMRHRGTSTRSKN